MGRCILQRILRKTKVRSCIRSVFLGLIFLIIIAITVVVAVSVSSSSRTAGRYYPPVYYDMDDFDDNFDYGRYEGAEVQARESSCFAYPDPYEMDPSQVMYLGEDGDLLEDL